MEDEKLQKKYALTPAQYRKLFITYKIINVLRPIYNNTENPLNEKEKGDIAQNIGASLFYVNNYGWYTGLISMDALKDRKEVDRLKDKKKALTNKDNIKQIQKIINGLKPTYDHIYPRKEVGHYYLKLNDLVFEELIATFTTKFGLTNLISKLENKDMDAAVRKYKKEKKIKLLDINKTPNIISDLYGENCSALKQDQSINIEKMDENIKKIVDIFLKK